MDSPGELDHKFGDRKLGSSAEERAVSEPAGHDHDLDALFGAPFAPFKRAVLAVSGGPDSMALMVLVAHWMASGRAPPGLTIDVATVDHGLRAGSSREADWVAERARALGFRHTTLVWGGNKPVAAVQERAREARYALLTAHASSDGRGRAAVVTAHTADDQAETLLMRLGRGSGLDGLSGMAPSRPLLPGGAVALVRPLLGLSKLYLMTTLRLSGSGWLEDPSNERIDFERVRVRAAHDHLAALGLTNAKLAVSAGRLLRAREALETVTAERLATLVDVHDGVFASLDRLAWRREPAEIRLRLLALLLRAFGGDARPAQLSQIEALEVALARDRPVAQTLGGCMVSQGTTTIRLYREPGFQTLPEVILRPGEEALWDWRFRVSRAAQNGEDGEPDGEPVWVRPLGRAAYATLRAGIAAKDRPPARAAAGLPAFWSRDRLLAVPGLAQTGSGDERFRAEFLGLERDLR